MLVQRGCDVVRPTACDTVAFGADWALGILGSLLFLVEPGDQERTTSTKQSCVQGTFPSSVTGNRVGPLSPATAGNDRISSQDIGHHTPTHHPWETGEEHSRSLSLVTTDTRLQSEIWANLLQTTWVLKELNGLCSTAQDQS